MSLPRACRRAALLLVALPLLGSPAAAGDRLRVLLLDYNAPDEHDVLQSHLCVDPCTPGNGCPEELLRSGADAFSDDFVVFRPRYLGRTSRFVVEAFADDRIDLLSISGHHASGFSGDLGRGRFDTELLATELEGSTAAPDFFTNPALVLLQGCRTDVKSTFDGDPVAYLFHVIQETSVREDEFERLIAAVQQIGGVQRAYRPLFPNACILGYRGSQAPGGRLEIYGQVDSFLRALVAVEGGGATPPAKLALAEARRSRAELAAVERAVERECPRGWPCNLCRVDGDYYRPQARALAAFLRGDRRRIRTTAQARSAASATALEQALEAASYYRNSRWSCSTLPPGTPPVWPDPVSESPFARLFVELLMLDMGHLDPEHRGELQAELVHRLGGIEFTDIDALELRVWLRAPLHRPLVDGFIDGPLHAMSTFRQRDFFTFLAAIGCADCLQQVLGDSASSLLRENAAAALRPALGPAVYRTALADPHPRVRQAAASHLTPALGDDVLRLALGDADPAVRGAAERALAQAASPEPAEGTASPAADPAG